MGRIIGIDLGTTNSLAAVYTTGGPEVLRLLSGASHLPSAVSIDPVEGLVIGETARHGAQLRPDSTVLSVKRHMGTDRRFLFGGEDLSPQAISALILKELKRVAEARLRAPVERAVISVPAYFNEVQRRATREAGEIAGFRVERLISEPTAAALAFGIERVQTDELVLVYDLGGGTFDVSILEMFEGILSVRACGGDSRLGGDDFDERLFQWLAGEAGRQLAGREVAPEARLQFRLATERAKIDLSSKSSTRVRLDDLPLADGDVETLEIEFSRTLFERQTRDLLERTGRCVARVLSEARLARERIGEVLLVGGSTRMPMVEAYLREFFGKEIRNHVDPMEAVVLGAAIQAHMLEEDTSLGDVIVTDVSPHTLGVAAVDEFDGELRPGVFVPLIHRNATLPTKTTHEFCTVHPGQDTVAIEVYQGDDPLVENNVFLERYYLGGLPKDSGRPEALDITFLYDMDGILHVNAVVRATGRSAGIRIDASRMQAVGKHQLGYRAHVAALWERSRSARRLRELIVQLEDRILDVSSSLRAALELKLRSAREALKGGNREAMERCAREVEALLGGGDS